KQLISDAISQGSSQVSSTTGKYFIDLLGTLLPDLLGSFLNSSYNVSPFEDTWTISTLKISNIDANTVIYTGGDRNTITLNTEKNPFPGYIVGTTGLRPVQQLISLEGGLADLANLQMPNLFIQNTVTSRATPLFSSDARRGTAGVNANFGAGDLLSPQL